MGFSIKDDKGEWSGFDVDFCRALAAAIFNDPSKMQYVPLTATERFDALESPFMKAGCGKTHVQFAHSRLGDRKPDYARSRDASGGSWRDLGGDRRAAGPSR